MLGNSAIPADAGISSEKGVRPRSVDVMEHPAARVGVWTGASPLTSIALMLSYCHRTRATKPVCGERELASSLETREEIEQFTPSYPGDVGFAGHSRARATSSIAILNTIHSMLSGH